MRKIILLLILLSTMASADSLIVYDMTDDFLDYTYVYNSTDYVTSFNITAMEEPISFTGGDDYYIYLKPDSYTGITDIGNDNFIRYWYHNANYIFFSFFIFIILTVIAWNILNR